MDACKSGVICRCLCVNKRDSERGKTGGGNWGRRTVCIISDYLNTVSTSSGTMDMDWAGEGSNKYIQTIQINQASILLSIMLLVTGL